MTTPNIKDWNVDRVSKWLYTLNLGHLSNKFEAMRIDGPALLKLDDVFIDTRLRLNPAEKSAFVGALSSLRSSSVQQVYGTRTLPVAAARSPRLSSMTMDPSNRSRSNSDSNRHVVKILPNDTPRQEPEVTLGPAMDLLKNCRHSGWIRKQGGSDNKKGWRQRYMILRRGHLYYYDRETSVKAKGYFSIQGYRVESCNYKGKPFCCKLIPDDPSERTYVVAAAAQHELDKWMEEIQSEIDSYEDHVYDPVAIEEEDEDDCNYEPMDGTDTIYDDLNDPGYVKLSQVQQPPLPPGGGSSTLPPGGGSSTFPPQAQTFPRPTTNNDIHSPLSPKRSMTATLPVGVGAGGRYPPSSPHVPPRSRESLAGSSVPTQNLNPENNLITEEENPYMRLIDDQNSPPIISQSLPPESILAPPTDIPSNNTYRPQRKSTDAANSSPVPLLKENRQQEFTEEEIADEDPYYIRLEQADDLMPDYCRFGSISRDEAIKKLTTDAYGNQKMTRPGVYLIRDSSHPDVLHVLSVWTGTECKHYKLFYKKDGGSDNKGYCLTEGKRFPTIPLLLSYYKQENLPKSPQVTLSDPYHPDDH